MEKKTGQNRLKSIIFEYKCLLINSMLGRLLSATVDFNMLNLLLFENVKLLVVKMIHKTSDFQLFNDL